MDDCKSTEGVPFSYKFNDLKILNGNKLIARSNPNSVSAKLLDEILNKLMRR